MPKTDICYVVSHGFAARMLLQTDLILKLANAGKKIAIVLPDISDKNFSDLGEHQHVKLYEADIPLTIFDDDYGFKRRYFLEDIEGNPVFMEKHRHSLYYSNSKHPWKRIRPIYYWQIYKLIKRLPSIRQRFKRREKRYLESGKVDEILQQIDPKVLVSTYPINYLEAKFLYAAEKLGVKKIIHLLSWDNIVTKGIFPVKADQYICWGSVMAEEFKSFYGVDDDVLSVCGVPHFDHHINKKKVERTVLDLGIDPSKPYVFFAMSSPRFAPYEIEIVEELANWGFQLIVRPHPQNVIGTMADKRWIGRLKKLEKPGVAVSFPALESSKIRWSMKSTDMDKLTDLLHFSSLVLNSGSTVSIDALMHGKPVIITSFDGDRKLNYWKSARRLIDYPHLEKFLKLGGAEVATDYSSLRNLIEDYLRNPERRLDERIHALESECYKPDGKATDRVVQTMLAYE